MADKEAVSSDISRWLGTPVRGTSAGGTVTRLFLEDVAGVLGVASSGLDKVQLMRSLVLRVGQPWDDSCASSHTASGGGGNITRTALERLLTGVRNQHDSVNGEDEGPDAASPPSLADLVWRQEYERIAVELDEGGHLDVNSLDDQRWRVFTAVAQRRGQQVFRRRLIRAYGGTCAISGCDAVAALEAAHVVPYLGDATNLTTNGLLLRADVHTLFDLGLLGVRVSDRSIVLDEQLHGSQYEEFIGRRLATARRPADAVDEAALHWRAEHIGPASARG